MDSREITIRYIRLNKSNIWDWSNLNIVQKEDLINLHEPEIIERLKQKRKEIDLDYIVSTVYNYYSVDKSNLNSKRRSRETVVQPRQICMYFAKELLKISLNQIGSGLGGKDHATCLHAHKTILNLIETDKKIRNDIEILTKKLNK